MGNSIKTIDNNMVAYINRNNTFVVEINGEEVKNEKDWLYHGREISFSSFFRRRKKGCRMV
ncbi:MAG: hypothetical protein IJN43_13115 [Ruminococcus sp.]|nr:hypothetical protein [Ruminococcus sp.]